MQALPDISLVISLYRSERYWRRFLPAARDVISNMRTAGVELEFVVVANDPSPEEDQGIADLEAAVEDGGAGRVVVLRVPREPLYASWNRGVEDAAADCVGFWNIDDTRNATALLEGIEAVRSGAGLIYFPYVIVEQGNRGLRRSIHAVRFVDVPAFDRQRFSREMHVGPFFLFSRSAWRETGRFDEQFHISGDFDWAGRVAQRQEVVRGTSTGGVFVSDGTGLSVAGSPRQVAEHNIIFLRQGADDQIVSVPPALMRMYRLDCPGVDVEIPAGLREQVFGHEGDGSTFDERQWRRRRGRREAARVARGWVMAVAKLLRNAGRRLRSGHSRR